MDRRQAVAIGIGGIIGATIRWAVLAATAPPPGFPWVLFAINIGGSAVLGAVLAETARHPRSQRILHDGVGIGFCGGLTTFSTFAVEVATFLRAGRQALALTYVSASVLGGVLAAVAGAAVLHRVRALMIPLEEGP